MTGGYKQLARLLDASTGDQMKAAWGGSSLRELALEALHTRDVLNSPSLPESMYRDASNREWQANKALLDALDELGLDRSLIAQLNNDGVLP